MTYALVAISVLVSVIGQLLFKAVAIRTSHSATVLDMWTIAMFAVAITLYALSTVSWVFALRLLPLSVAYAFFAISFIVTPIAAHLLFGERIGWGIVIGTILVASGLIAIIIDYR